ncbi:SMP-30/gluconolactonase/LRE family protein [Wohlfahrtiimonas chitiniclastica]|uniref:SMP-30/gluconolactonase/LRE family protein n=1 Tax=Wohlfahrtiimonas chitiniclastica TaxID=400946 RepID=A0AB35C0N0_9GAMM|nr:SMP-30/gluconolactonase/LRE family protein [Wohlfahrtiimonas chitiniclastica]MBS7817662.1 SMP-30/gluconolactonase/LRE family protein [Wohlfahrtiimonas chitiniclastica]MBS7823500.1 SMP-30/gluconolactonase/LRE family protein [Wohlfahrtiimonas chitiniclastica]MBS7825316.1 SMP-30/gluconolactonase/LRE family protein [Wohlfahrtiimonas chitiniclastica]MBS7831314.1 SMP-30/gluconolactonase/LRE family protein [Wohlfahrtiimonas chitiniclastica]MBS7833281.1 SMP-30/gluconolactonase/LRE family protein [W
MVKTWLGESPVWSERDQCLYYVDILGNAIIEYDPINDAHQSWPVDENIGCIGLIKEGGFIAAMRTGVYRLNAYGEKIEHLANIPSDPAHSRFNDGKVDPWGRFWCGTVFEGEAAGAMLCCMHANGTLEVIDTGLHIVNGIAFSPDGTHMLYSDTKTATIYRYPLDPSNGHIIGERSIFAKGGQPDGGQFDAQGHYWSADFGAGRLTVRNTNGNIIETLNVPSRYPTMMAFGGKDLTTLFVTSSREYADASDNHSGQLYQCKAPVKGVPAHYFSLGV